MATISSIRACPPFTSATTRATSSEVFPVPAPASTNRLRSKAERIVDRAAVSSGSTGISRLLVSQRDEGLDGGIVGDPHPCVVTSGGTDLVVRTAPAVLIGTLTV